jgi:predicted Fe-S protein YdhL (DUF1289 family)
MAGPSLPFAGGVPSPCISVCKIDDATGLCTGCLRTLDEIAAWSVLDDGQRRAVWRAIKMRRAAATLLAAGAGNR